MAPTVRADELHGTTSARHGMGGALRSESRPQRDSRPGRKSGLRSAFVQRKGRDAVVWGGAGARCPERRRQVRPARRVSTLARAVRARGSGVRGAAYLKLGSKLLPTTLLRSVTRVSSA